MIFLFASLLISTSLGYDINGVKKFRFRDTIGLEARGDSSGSCSFQLTKGASSCCYSCACSPEPCACGPGLEERGTACRDEGYNVTKVDKNLCILFLSDFNRRDVGTYEVTLQGRKIQKSAIVVKGLRCDKDKIEDGFLVKAAVNSTITIAAKGRAGRGCRFLYTSRDQARTCCYSHPKELCDNEMHKKQRRQKRQERRKRCKRQTNKKCVKQKRRNPKQCWLSPEVTSDSRRNLCTLRLGRARAEDSGNFTISFPGEYTTSYRGYKDKLVEVQVDCETHGLDCNNPAKEFLESARKYLDTCKKCESFNITCTGTGVQSELCEQDEESTHLLLSWGTDHQLALSCLKPGDPCSQYDPLPGLQRTHRALTRGGQGPGGHSCQGTPNINPYYRISYIG